MTEEHKRKIGLANKGKKRTKKSREKMRQTKLGTKRFFTKKHRAKISNSLKGHKVSNRVRGIVSLKLKGSNSPLWKGGISYLPYSVDWTETLRRSIRERDNYICQICNKLQGDTAYCVHYIDYDKKNCNPKNLITLCRSCHSKTNKNRKSWIGKFSCHNY